MCRLLSHLRTLTHLDWRPALRPFDREPQLLRGRLRSVVFVSSTREEISLAAPPVSMHAGTAVRMEATGMAA